MNPYCFHYSTLLTAFAPNNSPSGSHPINPRTVQYGCSSKTHLYQSHKHINIQTVRSKRSCSIFCSQNSENYGSLPSVLGKPRKNFQGKTNRTTFTMPTDTKPFSSIGIVSFLKGKNYLITGATGLVAKVIVEKILRMIPETGKIFVLIKQAKDKEEPMERLKSEIINSELFKSIKQMHGKSYQEFVMSKLIPVVGNVCESDLGIDADTANDLAKEVHVIVNSAATTSFDERYDVALNTNTKGPSRLLNFAKKCKNICLFLHISTAYVSDGEKQGIIMEKPLHMGQSIAMQIPELNIDSEMKLASEMVSSFKGNHQATAQKMKELGLERANLYGWPNTYSFTKAMGEMLINSFRDDIPVVILRPSVVESSYREPFPGWIEGYRVLDPLFFNYGRGQLPGFLADPKGVIDVIPVDMVANATMAAIAKHGAAAMPELTVYHIGSSVGNPVSVGAIFDYACGHFKSFPLLTSNGNEIIINKMNFFSSLDDFSSYILKEMAKKSGLLEATKMEPELHSILQKKTTKKAEVFIRWAKLYEPYMFYKGWFDNSNTQKLFRQMSNEEMKNFGFDVGSINWEQYISGIHIPGVRKHVLKR